MDGHVTMQQQAQRMSSQSTEQHTSPVAQHVAGIEYFFRMPARSCTTITCTPVRLSAAYRGTFITTNL